MTVALIVDDDPFMRTLTSALLTQLGLTEQVQASDGEEALRAIADHDICLVLCDLNMPGMDGIALLRHIAEVADPPAVVVFSAENPRFVATAQRLATAHRLDVLGTIQKPPTLDSLGPIVDELRRREERTESRSTVEPSSEGSAPERLSPEAVREGLERGCLTMAFQPQVKVSDKQVVGVEALARWDDPKRGLLGPWAFIGVAEEHGLINELTRQALDISVRQAARWAAAGHEFTVSVNVTIDDLSDVEFADVVFGCLKSHGLAENRLMLEVTESKIMRDVYAPLEVLTRLRMRGVSLALDDYGTGASSMEQLARLPFSELKVDRHFVSHAIDDPPARAMLESAVELARRLGLWSLAEGVETEEEWDLIASLGCDRVQGYLIAPPLPAARFDNWLTTWRERHDLQV